MVEEEGGEPDEVGGAPSLNKFSVIFFIYREHTTTEIKDGKNFTNIERG